MCFTTLCKESGQTALSHFLKRNFIGCPPILNTRLDHNTWNYCDFPALCKKHMSSLTFPANQYREGTGEGAYGLLSLSKKTTTSNHLQCHNKGNTFSWVILRRWVLVQSQARNSRPPMGIKVMCEKVSRPRTQRSDLAKRDPKSN